MSKKTIIGLILSGSLAILAGWALVLPALNNRTANEMLSDIPGSSQTNQSVSATPSEKPKETLAANVETLSKGTLRGMNRQSSEGDVTIVKVDGKTYVRLEDNFTVSNGPDLLVGLGNDGSVQELIGDLKANSGGQNYLVPDGIDINKFSQVFIHCRAFKYSFAVADLQKV